MATTPQPALRGLATGTEITVPLVRPPKQAKDEKDEDFKARVERSERYTRVKLVVRRLDHKTVRRLAHELDRLESRVRGLMADVKNEVTPEQLAEAQEAVMAHHRAMLLQPVVTWGGVNLGSALVRLYGIEVEFPGGDVQQSDDKGPEELLRWLEQLDLLELAGGALLLAQEPTRELGN